MLLENMNAVIYGRGGFIGAAVAGPSPTSPAGHSPTI
jgi:hypothetical protein